jgi:hypothetical protein
MPEAVSSFVASGITDENGFTGTEQAQQLQQLFPLKLIKCVAVVQGGIIEVFDSTVSKLLSRDGKLVQVESLFCNR